ncbi:MAG: c-type cytochrome, partial [Proteobacteria bacterium]|nr:c-type cytochrome [Pseudomonadota bacterium]
MKKVAGALGLALMLAGSAVSAQELQQAGFSAAQAARGETLYQQNCAACHLADLTGSFEGPNLADSSFRSNWANRGVAEFTDLLRRTMPPQAPGSLNETQYL